MHNCSEVSKYIRHFYIKTIEVIRFMLNVHICIQSNNFYLDKLCMLHYMKKKISQNDENKNMRKVCCYEWSHLSCLYTRWSNHRSLLQMIPGVLITVFILQSQQWAWIWILLWILFFDIFLPSSLFCIFLFLFQIYFFLGVGSCFSIKWQNMCPINI